MSVKFIIKIIIFALIILALLSVVFYMNYDKLVALVYNAQNNSFYY